MLWVNLLKFSNYLTYLHGVIDDISVTFVTFRIQYNTDTPTQLPKLIDRPLERIRKCSFGIGITITLKVDVECNRLIFKDTVKCIWAI